MPDDAATNARRRRPHRLPAGSRNLVEPTPGMRRTPPPASDLYELSEPVYEPPKRAPKPRPVRGAERVDDDNDPPSGGLNVPLPARSAARWQSRSFRSLYRGSLWPWTRRIRNRRRQRQSTEDARDRGERWSGGRSESRQRRCLGTGCGGKSHIRGGSGGTDSRDDGSSKTPPRSSSTAEPPPNVAAADAADSPEEAPPTPKPAAESEFAAKAASRRRPPSVARGHSREDSHDCGDCRRERTVGVRGLGQSLERNGISRRSGIGRDEFARDRR